jgi:hypothetical protein
MCVLIYTYIYITLYFTYGVSSYKWHFVISYIYLYTYLLPIISHVIFRPNVRMYNDAFFSLDFIAYYGVILYNWCFTVAFAYQLVKINSKTNVMNSRIKNRTILLIGKTCDVCIYVFIYLCICINVCIFIHNVHTDFDVYVSILIFRYTSMIHIYMRIYVYNII